MRPSLHPDEIDLPENVKDWYGYKDWYSFQETLHQWGRTTNRKDKPDEDPTKLPPHKQSQEHWFSKLHKEE